MFSFTQCSLTVLMAADELPTKILHLWAKLDTDATINIVTPLNRTELCENVVF